MTKGGAESSSRGRLADRGISGRNHALLLPEIPRRCAPRDDTGRGSRMIRHSGIRHSFVILVSSFVIHTKSPSPRPSPPSTGERGERYDPSPASHSPLPLGRPGRAVFDVAG